MMTHFQACENFNTIYRINILQIAHHGDYDNVQIEQAIHLKLQNFARFYLQLSPDQIRL